MDERAGETIQGRGTAIKRRGILAAAGAAVAGIMAKQMAESVSAANSPLQFPSSGTTAASNTATAPTILTGAFDGAYDSTVLQISNTSSTSSARALTLDSAGGQALLARVTDRSGFATSAIDAQNEMDQRGSVGLDARVGRFVVNTADTIAVKATNNSFGDGGSAVSGFIPGAVGGASSTAAVRGVNGARGSNTVGVLGSIPSFLGDVDTITFPGRIGVAGTNFSGDPGGIGVFGMSNAGGGAGVQGMSRDSFPAIGQVVGTDNTHPGVTGFGTAGPGTQGQSLGGHGAVGLTVATDGQHAGVLGYVYPPGNAIGVRGSVPAGATGFAGVFDGDVTINGALRVYGAPKNAAVRHPADNSYRLLYCEEATESWFADYGRGTLAGGRAEVKLDPDFAALVHADDYHVFLTADGSTYLYLEARTAVGFTVVGAPIAGAVAGGPKRPEGTGTFSWRVVARRKDIAGERLAKVAPPPPLKSVIPFTVPETPEARPPAKKP